MKYSCCAVALAALSGSAAAFMGSPLVASKATSSSSLSMVLEKPKEKKISKLELLKVQSDHLIHPLKEVRYKQSYPLAGVLLALLPLG